MSFNDLISAISPVIQDNVQVALDIETTAGEDWLLIDTENSAENMIIAGGNYPVMIGSEQRGPRMRQGHGSSAVPGFPVYTFRGDTDTGMTHLGTSNDDSLSFVAGGVEIARAVQLDSGTIQNILAVGTDIADIVSAPQASLHVRNDSVSTQAAFQRDGGLLLIQASAANLTINANEDLRLEVNGTIRQCIDKTTGNVGFGTCDATAEVETVGHIDTALSGTFTATNGDTAISSGSSTAFLTELHVGSAIKIGSEGTYTVAAIASDTALTLDSNFTGSTGSGKSGTTDGGELFAVKTGDSQTRFAVNASGAMTLGTKPGSEDSSIAIGDGDALDTLTTGKSNIIIGHASDNYKLTSGKRHIFIGYRAGEDITTTDNNVIIGFEGAQAATGANNVFVGAEVAKNATGSDCVAIGKGTMMNCTGTDSVAIGASALDGSADSDQCVAIGSLSLSSNNSASANGNVGVGYASMFSCTSGSNNTAIGRNVAGGITTAQNCVVIGKDANVSAGGVDNEIVIGKGAAGNGSNTITLGNSSIGAIHANTDSITAFSDLRIKDNIRDSSLGLDFINALRPVKYEKKHPSEYPEEIRPAEYSEQTLTRTRKDDDGNEIEFTETIEAETKPEEWQPTTEYGLIAQEVKAVMESQNATDWQGHKTLPNGTQSLGYGSLITVLVKAVQELTARIDQLESGE